MDIQLKGGKNVTRNHPVEGRPVVLEEEVEVGINEGPGSGKE